MYFVGGKTLSRMKSMLSLACIKVKGGGRKLVYQIEIGMRQGLPFSLYMDKVMKGGVRVRFLEEGREWRLPCLLYADDLILCGKSEEDLKVMVGRFVEVCM